MSASAIRQNRPGSLRLRLPATSANVGPGFDALGLAFSLHLTLEASVAAEFSIKATGRDAEITGQISPNLIFSTYTEILAAHGCPILPLALALHNEIPVGMGCGSSAAALCAGVLLANHFGDLGWDNARVLNEAAEREGHPDNVAACLFGGLTVSKVLQEAGVQQEGSPPARILTATFGVDLPWRLLLALPRGSLSTTRARHALPPSYSRGDTVLNLQSVALLVSAFALNRSDLLPAATEDRLHQPYRGALCPLLPALLPLRESSGVHSVTLSGAGPSVLLIVAKEYGADSVVRAADDLLHELLELRIAAGASVEGISNPRKVT